MPHICPCQLRPNRDLQHIHNALTMETRALAFTCRKYANANHLARKEHKQPTALVKPYNADIRREF